MNEYGVTDDYCDLGDLGDSVDNGESLDSGECGDYGESGDYGKSGDSNEYVRSVGHFKWKHIKNIATGETSPAITPFPTLTIIT